MKDLPLWLGSIINYCCYLAEVRAPLERAAYVATGSNCDEPEPEKRARELYSRDLAKSLSVL